MHLSYLYIKDFAVLKNVGFTFDNHFVFTMTEGVLQIKRNIALPERFWGNGIYSKRMGGTGTCFTNNRSQQ